ncbi:MAG: hypothetical protein PVI99_09715 [Anaerolineales bacterium]|jgi:hypothetical protein
MLHSPGEYLNAIAEEGHEGKHNGFFSTPTNVTRFMSEIIGATKGYAFASGHYALVDGLWQCNVPGNTPQERRRMLEQSVSDPCVGAGNMPWDPSGSQCGVCSHRQTSPSTAHLILMLLIFERQI